MKVTVKFDGRILGFADADGVEFYWINIQQMTENERAVAFWWRQLAGKRWATREVLNQVSKIVCDYLEIP
jgi:hypothetical protein